MKKLTAKEKAIVRRAADSVTNMPYLMACFALNRAGDDGGDLSSRFLLFYGVTALPFLRESTPEGETYLPMGPERQGARVLALLLFAETGGVL